jgi:hypothetical protein
MYTKKNALPILIVLVLVISACAIFPIQPTLVPTNTVSAPTQIPPTAAPPTATLMPTATLPVPTLTPTLPPATNTPVPTQVPPTATLVPLPTNPAAANYIDDRSTPSQVIVSYFNAINRREYSRAYGYYTNPSTTLGTFTAFSNGYANTVSVELVFGPITGDSGAGQTYFTTPVVLKAATSNGAHTNYAACYIVHQANPGFFGGPNFDPMSINQGQAKVIPAGQSDTDALATACAGLPSGGSPVATGAETLDISKNNFIDNRSGPIETISSLLNALNLKQYSRGYSYFDSPQTFPGDFDTWQAGYTNTDSITAVFGSVQIEGAAGSTYYKVPVGFKVSTTSNTTQTFVGCYTLRLAQPANQAQPPYHPLSIVSGQFNQVDNNADVNALLPAACP